VFSPPATDAALFCTGEAFWWTDFAAEWVALPAPGFLTGARGAAGFLATPLTWAAIVCICVLVGAWLFVWCLSI